MSRIFDVILVNSFYEELEHNLPAINDWLDHNNHNSMTLVNSYAGGEKVCTAGIALASFNHLYVESFLEFLRSLPWKKNTDLLVRGSYIYEDEWFRWKVIFRERGHSKYLH